MSYIVNGKTVKNVGLITEPSSYGLTATPENMQSGTTAIVDGKVVKGTGKAFEFASHGLTRLYTVIDENGNNKIGCMISESFGSNILFISSTSDSDRVSQDVYMVDMTDKKSSIIGKNQTTLSDIRVYHSNGYLVIYSDNVSNNNTFINYFEGKDNEL